MATRNGSSGRTPRIKSSPMTKAGVPLDQRIQGGFFLVSRKPRGIEADGAGDGQDVIEVEGAVRPQQRPVKLFVQALRP